MSTTTEVLRKAKSLIPDEAHWWRGDGDIPEGMHCAGTALKACGADEYASRLFASAIGFHVIPFWNDEPGRTLAEVHAAFDLAIAMGAE